MSERAFSAAKAARATVDVAAKQAKSSAESTIESAQSIQSASASLAAAQAAVGIATPSNIASTTPVTPATAPQATSATGTASSPARKYCPNSKPNIMEEYASVNYLFTMACVNIGEFNSASYRSGGFTDVVFSSAGRFDGQRVSTAQGKPEYFVENFQQTNVIAPNPKIGNTYAVKYTFEVFEPYSMGVFLQSVTAAAIKKGYKTHIEAPFVIKLEFAGFDNDGNSMPGLVEPKYFPMRLTKMDFTVDEAGSKYYCEAVPYNQFSYSDATDTIISDVAIEIEDGKTVKDALVNAPDSLEKALNKIREDQKDTKRTAGSEVITYKIEFPIPGSDGDTNEIGTSKFEYKMEDGGRRTMQKADETYKGGTLIDKENKVIVEHGKRKILFSQGESIVSAITKIINISQHVFKEAHDKKDTNNGFRTHYKIDIQETLDSYDEKLQVLRKTIRYRVRPYGVHEAMYKNPASTPVGYDFIQNSIVKEYHYMYTGQNVDILNFDIKVNYLFYHGINPKSETETPELMNQGQGGAAESPVNKVPMHQGANPQAGTAAGQGQTHVDPNLLNPAKGGSSLQTIENQIAENFHRAFVEATSADMVMLDLKILGDPYWLSDSGPGNHTVSIAAPAQETKDGTMNYENSDIFVYVVFRAPSDVDVDAGKYIFPERSSFGGIYRVTQVENQFEKGMFTQTLKGVRMIGQSLEYGATNQPGDTKVQEITEELDTRTEPIKPTKY